jgi:hypothetical protein
MSYPYTLRVVFEGLILFVPDKPFHSDPAQGPRNLRAFFPNLLKPRILPVKSKTILPSHFPFLDVSEHNLRPEAPSALLPADFGRQVAGIAETISKRSFGLHWFDVELRPEGRSQNPDALTTSNGQPDSRLSLGQREPRGKERSWIRWIGDLEAAASQHGSLDPRFAGSLMQGDPDVIARISFSEGHLVTNELHDHMFFQFRTSKADFRHQQWMAKQVAVEFKGLKKDSSLRFRGFSEGRLSGELMVGPRAVENSRERSESPSPSEAEEIVEICLFNREIDGFIGLEDNRSKPSDPEFLALYGLTSRPRGPRRRLPVPTVRASGPVGSRPGGCSPGTGRLQPKV